MGGRHQAVIGLRFVPERSPGVRLSVHGSLITILRQGESRQALGRCGLQRSIRRKVRTRKGRIGWEHIQTKDTFL